MQILTFTIPPSRRCRATSLCTREAFCLSASAHLLTTASGGAIEKSRYGYKSISAILLSFRTRLKRGRIFLSLYGTIRFSIASRYLQNCIQTPLTIFSFKDATRSIGTNFASITSSFCKDKTGSFSERYK